MQYSDLVNTIITYGTSSTKMMDLAINDLGTIMLLGSREELESNVDVAIVYGSLTSLKIQAEKLRHHIESIVAFTKELKSEMEPPRPRVFKFDDEGNMNELPIESDEAMAILAADKEALANEDTFELDEDMYPDDNEYDAED